MIMSKNMKILNCPICGKKPELVIDSNEYNFEDSAWESGLIYYLSSLGFSVDCPNSYRDDHENKNDTWYYIMDDCGNNCMPTKELAVDNWNRRVERFENDVDVF